MDQAILNEQLGYFLAPVGFHNIATEWVALPLMQFGTEEQKRRFLPPIARADVSYAPTLTEPEAGSDLANLKTTAATDLPQKVIGGQTPIDVNVAYDLPFDKAATTIYLNVQDVFNVLPPNFADKNSNNNYDYIGRFYRLGFRVSL